MPAVFLSGSEDGVPRKGSGLLVYLGLWDFQRIRGYCWDVEYSVDCPNSGAWPSRYSRNILLIVHTCGNRLWVALAGVGFPLTGRMKYMDAARIRWLDTKTSKVP